MKFKCFLKSKFNTRNTHAGNQKRDLPFRLTAPETIFRYFLASYYSKILVSFRTRNHKLPIENGRWNNVPLRGMVCHLCEKDLGDEFHYILSCEYFPYYRTHPFILKLKQLMNSTNFMELKNYINLYKCRELNK